MLPKKIPTIVGILIILFVIGTISFVIQETTRFQSQAISTSEPKNVLVTNTTGTSATVVWQTDTPVNGVITISTPKGKLTAYDERDLTGTLGKYTTHSVTVKNLEPNTTHEINIISNGKPFPAGGKGYTLVTGPELMTESTNALDPAYGLVRGSDGKPADGAIVLLTIEDTQTLSTLVRPTGSWMIPLSSIRTKDLISFAAPRTQAAATITVLLAGLKTETITDTLNMSPVPDMILGNTYDFRGAQSKKNDARTLAQQNSTGSVLGTQTSLTPTQTLGGTAIGGISITSPKEGTKLVSPKPLIQGKGVAGKSVTVTVGIKKPETGKTTVDTNGLWQYTPKIALAEGPESVTATSVDASGKTVAVTVNFSILKSGSQVLGDATPSATPSSTVSPTPESTDTGEPLPEPGSPLPTILLMILGIGLIAGGATLLL
jgi:hypothetical protein